MTAAELNLKEYKEGGDLLEAFRVRLEAGELMSLLIVAERADGQMEGGCTTTQNVFTLAGYMLYWILQRIGFAPVPTEGRET